MAAALALGVLKPSRDACLVKRNGELETWRYRVQQRTPTDARALVAKVVADCGLRSLLTALRND